MNIHKRAEEMFDEEFPKLVKMTDGLVYRNVCDKDEVKSFISKIIDMAQEERDKQWVNVLNQVERPSSAIKMMNVLTKSVDKPLDTQNK